MNEQHHDPAIEKAIDCLAITDPASLLAAFPQHDADSLERSYSELLGLLSFAEAPQMPSSGIKAGLLQRIAHERNDPRADLGAIPAAAASQDNPNISPADVSSTEELRPVATEATAAAAAGGGNIVTMEHRRPALSPWSIAMAAILGLCVISLAFLAGRLREQQQQITALQANARLVSESAEKENLLVANELQAAQQRLDMITRVARQVYPMRSLEGTARLASARKQPRGVVWVCGQHQRWLLSVQGLEPAPQGSVYTLWFMTDHGPVKGGAIEVSGSGPGELAASFMPDGTHSFQVTLETDANGTAPGGTPVMMADRSLQI